MRRVPDWTDDAICAQTDPELFFPDKGSPAEPARRVCAQCPVATECLQAALTDPSLTGVWGGTTYMERRDLRAAA